MLKTSRFLALCLSISWIAAAAQDEPAVLAGRFFSQKLSGQGLPADFKFDPPVRQGNIWIFECSNPVGFVLVKQTKISRIVGYSVGNRFTRDNKIPDPAQDFLTSMSAYEFNDTAFPPLKSTFHPIGPMIRTTWSQEGYFNYYCPEDPEGPDQHVYSGCAAVAMGQILRYYGKFNDFNVTAELQDQKYGRLTAEVGNFDWLRMENRPIILDQEVSRLLYALGVLTSMNYGPTGSTTSNFNVYDSFKKLKYFNAVRMVRATTANTVWINNFQQNIASFQPIYVSGSGHSFICDGIDSEGLFHFNLGWYGYGDGYYPLNAVLYLIPSEAIFGLRPYSNNLPPTNLTLDSAGGKKVLRWEKNPKTMSNPDHFRVYLNDTLFYQTRDTTMNIDSFPPGNYELMVSGFYPQGESVWIGPVTYRSESGRVSFLDDNLRLAILQELVRENIPLGPDAPTLNQMLHLQKLEITQAVGSLDGLENCKNLQILKIMPEVVCITDLAPVSRLRRLKWLALKNSDSTALSKLFPNDRLIKLELYRCETGNLGFLANLNRLLTLRIIDSPNTETQVITGMNSLRELTISGCNLVNPGLVQTMTNLEAIDLSHNQIQRFRLPNALPELSRLDISHNQINELFFLENIPNIQQLDLGHNQLSRFISGVNYRHLKELSLNNNVIDSIWIGVPWPAMASLSLNGNKIRSISRMKDFMPGLERLDLADNHITEFWTGSLQKLKYLDFSGNSLSLLDKLADNPKLRHIDLANNRVSDIHPLIGKVPESDYKYIDLTGNPISAESLDLFAPTLLSVIDTLLLPDLPQPLSPCYPQPARNQALTGPTAELGWIAGEDEGAARFEIVMGTSPDSLTLTGSTFQSNLTVGISPGRRYYWRVNTVLPDSSFLSGLYRFVTYQPIILPFKEGFETYPAFSNLTAQSDHWLKPSDSIASPTDGRIDPFRRYEGSQGLKMMNSANLTLPLGHLYQSTLTIAMQVLIGDGCLATVNLKGINGGDMDFHFKSNKRCDLLINDQLVSENTYPTGEWFPISMRLYSRGEEIWIKIGSTDLMIPWVFTGQAVHAEELVMSSSPGRFWPTSGQALFYVDNLEIKASGALGTNPGMDPGAIKVYPNPADDAIYIEIPGGFATPEIRLIDSSGREVGVFVNLEGLERWRLNTGRLPPGYYVLKVISGSYSQASRMIITR